MFELLALRDPQGLRGFQPDQYQFGQDGVAPGLAEEVNPVHLAPDELLALVNAPGDGRQMLHQERSVPCARCLHPGG